MLGFVPVLVPEGGPVDKAELIARRVGQPQVERLRHPIIQPDSGQRRVIAIAVA
ncbi:hypothetical protein KTN05_16785 [Paracoccus sp. Z118]|uniref:hypothetical protein n=1 Tax=Paracoccus sp. Z118 TaxID=2851017 RepID=UPI001C2C08E7|nr:hypothetical protein [Paracoccus sp. Z118]MBV0893458.1 hypothetical protein [Paracoccus sp. Z118]